MYQQWGGFYPIWTVICTKSTLTQILLLQSCRILSVKNQLNGSDTSIGCFNLFMTFCFMWQHLNILASPYAPFLEKVDKFSWHGRIYFNAKTSLHLTVISVIYNKLIDKQKHRRKFSYRLSLFISNKQSKLWLSNTLLVS